MRRRDLGDRKPTAIGDSHSLEVVEEDGVCFAQNFGQRHSGGGERPDWRALVTGVPRAPGDGRAVLLREGCVAAAGAPAEVLGRAPLRDPTARRILMQSGPASLRIVPDLASARRLNSPIVAPPASR